MRTPMDPSSWLGPEPRDQSARRATAEECLRMAKTEGIQLVGIAEHNDVSWIAELREAARRLGVYLLPGFEVRSRDGTDIVCLFDPDVGIDALTSMLDALGLDPEKRRHERLEHRSTCDAREILNSVPASHAGICIPATSPLLDGEPLWVKVDGVSAGTIGHALSQPAARISRKDPYAGQTGARLVSARWKGGFLRDVDLLLNPGLNCLIGGKGTGKSSVIETLRYALDIPYGTTEIEQAASGLLHSAFRFGSVFLEVETAVPRQRFRIERTNGEAPIVRDSSGSRRPDLQPTAVAPVRVYGQKELHAIAQNSVARLEMLDSYAAKDLRDPIAREAALMERCRENAKVVAKAVADVELASEALEELDALREERERYRRAGCEPLLAMQRRLDREERLLHAVRETLTVIAGHTTAIRRDLDGRPTVDDASRDELPNLDLVGRAQDLLGSIDAKVQRDATVIAEEVEQSQEQLGALQDEWARRRESRRPQLEQALRTLAAKLPGVPPERYLEVERRITELEPRREALDKAREALVAARSEREQLLAALADVRAEKSGIRQRVIDELNERLGGSVRAHLQPKGLRFDFADKLRSFGIEAKNAVLRGLVKHPSFSQREFVAAARENRVTDTFQVPQGLAVQIQSALDEEALLELEIVDLPDLVKISLDISVNEPNRRYRGLHQLSPGQRTTAILLLVLQLGSQPLVIDQPEDDLDNRFIYTDVVRYLKATKQRRQLLIATHNANIPVLGEAEQIVAFDTEVKDSRYVGAVLEAQGSLDRRRVRRAAEQILEGGRSAFEHRRARYAID